MFYLFEIAQFDFISDIVKKDIYRCLEKSYIFLKSKVNKNYFMTEPEMIEGTHYIISMVTSAALFKKYARQSLVETILNNVSKFFHNEEMYLFINDTKLFNGSLYKFKDSLAVETLYWLIQSQIPQT
jgi:hypothetical protein